MVDHAYPGGVVAPLTVRAQAEQIGRETFLCCVSTKGAIGLVCERNVTLEHSNRTLTTLRELNDEKSLQFGAGEQLALVEETAADWCAFGASPASDVTRCCLFVYVCLCMCVCAWRRWHAVNSRGTLGRVPRKYVVEATPDARTCAPRGVPQRPPPQRSATRHHAARPTL